jgi:hypothetical protein
MDLFKSIQLLALKDVMEPDFEYILRKIRRHHAKTFFTPLAVVEEIPVEDLLQTYFEERYENMSKEDLEKERVLLTETKEQRDARVLKQEKDKTDDLKILEEVIKKEQAQNTPPKPPPSVPEEISMNFEDLPQIEKELKSKSKKKG